ncbi:hypothetical protein AAEX28_01940 [Lentisphaerota bacterium WC36G]|nr:hypothetical protein LJT99_04825 [Lentisphaerae bacterium WC36]
MKKLKYFILTIYCCFNTILATENQDFLYFNDNWLNIKNEAKKIKLKKLKNLKTFDFLYRKYSKKKLSFLEVAILQGNLDALKTYIKHNKRLIINKKKNYLTPLLTLATISNDYKIVKFLINNNTDVGNYDFSSYYVLAINRKIDKNIFSLLINNKKFNFNYNFKNNKLSFFTKFLNFQNRDNIELLLKNIDKLNSQNQGYALEYCVYNKYHKLEQFVRKKGVKDTLYTLLYSKNEDDKMLKLIQKKLKGWKPDNKINGHDSLLRWTFASGSLKKIKLVLDEVPSELNNNFLKRKTREFTVLSIAMSAVPKNQNYYNILQLLIDKGAVINVNLDKYISPMFIATSLGELKVLKMFKCNGGNILELDKKDSGMLPLITILNAKQDMIEYYIKNNANINYTFKGLPAVAWAIKKERLEILKLLLKHEAKREFIDPETKKSISIIKWTKKLNAKTPIKNYDKIMKLLKN